MTRRVTVRSDHDLIPTLSSALGVSPEEQHLLPICREFAFSADNHVDFLTWYQREQGFSKWKEGADKAALRDTALVKFHQAEEIAGDANRRLVDWKSRIGVDIKTLERARTIIRGALGKFKLDELPTACRFGPGSSTGVKARFASHQYKWDFSSHITRGALPYMLAFQKWTRVPGFQPHLEVVPGNKVTTVPKNWKTDRCIAIEPDWNMFFQLGVGSMIRRRLQRYGILAPTAQLTNRWLARWGSWTGYVATLDLSMASDTVSLALCEALLPADWFKVLMDLRSPVGELPDGKVVAYEKISSMGNGFTFELETLIFWALARAVCRKDDWQYVSVYGDDIIVPAHAAPAMVDILTMVGFSLNSEKSFSEGPFRESCGGHYWEGHDVTPFYVREKPRTLGGVINLGNAILTHCSRLGLPDLGVFEDSYRKVLSMVPRKFRGPYGLAGCLWQEWDRCTPVWSKDCQTYRIATVQRKHRFLDVSDWTGSYYHALWTNCPEVEMSRLPEALTAEKEQLVFADRESWSTLPVRTLCR